MSTMTISRLKLEKAERKLRRVKLGVLLFSGMLLALFVLPFGSAMQAQEEPLMPLEDIDAPGSPDAGDFDEPQQRRMEKRRRRREGWREPSTGRPGQRRGHRKGKGQGQLGRLQNFLRFVHNYIGVVQDPYQAVGFAALGIKELYKRKGEPEQAIPELEELLEGVKDQKMRNVILFIIRQIHEERKAKDKYLALNKLIIKENIKSVEESK